MSRKTMWRRLRVAGGEYLQELAFGIIASSLIPIRVRPVLLRLMGVKVGTRCHIRPATIFNRSNTALGNGVTIGQGVYMDGGGHLEVGERVHIGPHSRVLTTTHSIMPDVYRRDRDEVVFKTTQIGRGVWIGAGTTVLPGVRVGEGCVIAAGAVVSRSCEPNGLYSGVPARRVRDLPLDTSR